MQFWYPYGDFIEASRKLGRFTDRAIGPTCGITYCDGMSVALVRRPQGRDGTFLNFYRRHVAVAPRPFAAPASRLRRLEQWMENALEAVGEAQLRQAEAQTAASQAVMQWAHDDLWLPAHQFLLRHKLAADIVGVGMDVVGVVAGVALFIAAAPLVTGGAAVIGVGAVVSGVAAGLGSVILLVADGQVLGAELQGDEAAARRIEDDPKWEWARVVATFMLLPDIAVGGPRALKEIGKLAVEARSAGTEARAAEAASLAQRERMTRIRNPARHPGPLQRHAHRARVLAAEAKAHQAAVLHAHERMAMLTARDIGASYAASPTSAALLAGLPPKMLESRADIANDERILDLLKPEHGMPPDVKLEARVSGIHRAARR